MHRGDYEQGRARLEESLAIGRAAGNQVSIATVTNNLGYLFQEQKSYLDAAGAYAKSAAAYRELRDKLDTAAALCNHAYALLAQGDVISARALCEDSLAIARDLPDAKAIAWSCLDLALVHLHQQDWNGAQLLLMESLRAGHGLVHARADEARIAFCLKGLARVAAAQGSHERALRLFSASEALRVDRQRPRTWSGTALWAAPPFDAASVEEWLSRARAELGADGSAAAVSAGRAMSLQQAVAFAAQPDAGSTGMGTDEEGSVKSHDPTGPRWPDSAKREIVKR